MPYIKKEDRPQYIPFIQSTVLGITSNNDKYMQLDCLAYFIDNLRQCINGKPPVFTGDFIDVDMKRVFDAHIKHFEAILLDKRKDLFDQAGELNYIISAVVWGVLGDSIHAEPARYGYRTFVKAILETIYACLSVSTSKVDLMLRGVLSDVIDEMYRRKTSIFEDDKIKMNGDLWPLRNVSWKETVPIESVPPDELSQNFLA